MRADVTMWFDDVTKLWVNYLKNIDMYIHADTAPLAICRAWLLWYEERSEEK